MAFMPADVAVVVGAEHDDDPVEAALALVEVVGQVAGDVGRLPSDLMTTRSLSSPKSVVRSHDRAVLLEDVALLAQPGDGALDRAGLVQRVLVEVDVEVDAEVVQRRP